MAVGYLLVAYQAGPAMMASSSCMIGLFLAVIYELPAPESAAPENVLADFPVSVGLQTPRQLSDDYRDCRDGRDCDARVRDDQGDHLT